MRIRLALTALLLASPALAGPEDPSRFVAIDYGAQKVMYDFNFAEPKDGIAALGFIRNHIAALKKHGDFKKSHFVMIAHGNELHAYSRKNRSAFPEAYKALKEITDEGVEIHICSNAARSRGYKPDEFYDIMTVVPAAVIDIPHYAGKGYSYMYPAMFPRITRDEIKLKSPGVED